LGKISKTDSTTIKICPNKIKYPKAPITFEASSFISLFAKKMNLENLVLKE